MTQRAAKRLQPSKATGKTPHLTIVLCTMVIVAFFYWAMVSPLDIASMAMGEVAPSSQVKTVQHLEGGIVREILVNEGDFVRKGQPLIKLEPIASGADVNELEVRLISLKTDIIRFEALLSGVKQPEFSVELEQDHPQNVQQSLQRFHAQTKRNESEIARQQETIAQRKQEILEIRTRIKSSKENLKIVNERVKISESLVRGDLSSRFAHLEILAEFTRINGAVETDIQSLASAEAAVKEAEAEMEAMQSIFEDENQQALDEARRTYDELYERFKKFEDSLQRTIVRTPVDGVIKEIHIATIGGVLRPGDGVADIVPGADRLIVDAQLPTQDIGYVQVGQSAVVKLTSTDAARFGNLNGKVINVSPDTLETPDGVPYYKVRIETEQPYFEHGSLRYNLFPGMQVMVSIQTGTRTVMQYILDPLMRNMGSALQER